MSTYASVKRVQKSPHITKERFPEILSEKKKRGGREKYVQNAAIYLSICDKIYTFT